MKDDLYYAIKYGLEAVFWATEAAGLGLPRRRTPEPDAWYAARREKIITQSACAFARFAARFAFAAHPELREMDPPETEETQCSK